VNRTGGSPVRFYRQERQERKDLKIFLAHFAGFAVQMYGKNFSSMIARPSMVLFFTGDFNG
jgi:hypothetical protein